MFAIPLYIFLLLYILFALGNILFFLFDLYHIVAAGEVSFTSLAPTVITAGLMVIVILATWYALAESNIDWNASFSPFDATSSSSVDPF